MTTRWLQMFIRTRSSGSRVKTKTMQTHPDWFISDEEVDPDAIEFVPERWDVVNHQLASLTEAVYELTIAVGYKNTGKTPPKVPRVTRPTSAIQELQKQRRQIAENRAQLDFLGDLHAAGELPDEIEFGPDQPKELPDSPGSTP